MNDRYCSNGPVSSMPGSVSPVLEGEMCDEHPDRPAVRRRQGETDSFGCEYFFVCQECDDALKLALQTPVNGYCEWHTGEGEDIRPMRDYDEGSCGRLYNTCRACRDKVHLAALKELEENPPPDDWGYQDMIDEDNQ